MSVTISVFESLTARNPDIQSKRPGSFNLTTNSHYMYPKELKLWDEFNFQTLKEMYGGELLNTALQKDSALLSYSNLIADADCRECNEDTTRHILTKWNHTIVQAALTAVQSDFHACSWSSYAGGRKKLLNGRSTYVSSSSSPGQTPPLQPTAGKGKIQPAKYKPDAGGALICRTHGIDCPSSDIERLPKDYKVSMKWKSSQMIDRLIDGSGTWKSGKSSSRLAMPIRQVYTYCVTYKCRYGCILTTMEAFIFRIRPRKEGLSSIEFHSRTDELLEEKLISDGMMEYMSIPWKKDEVVNNPLTFNLAVWFVHILAGNHHEVDWDYSPLKSEKLTEKTCTASQAPVTPESQRRPSSRSQLGVDPAQNKSLKRRRGDAADEINFSFTESQTPFASFTQSSDRQSQISEQSTDEETPEPRRQAEQEVTTNIQEPDAADEQILKRRRSNRISRPV